MDTTMRITILCDADKCFIYPVLSYFGEVTVWDLQIEYKYFLWNKSHRLAVVAVADMFKPSLEQAAKSIAAFKEIFNLSLYKTYPIEPLSKSFTADYRRAWRENCNNYRKLNHMPLIRRSRCRWRPRESRRAMDGLSPGIVVIDEYAFAEDGRSDLNG